MTWTGRLHTQKTTRSQGLKRSLQSSPQKKEPSAELQAHSRPNAGFNYPHQAPHLLHPLTYSSLRRPDNERITNSSYKQGKEELWMNEETDYALPINLRAHTRTHAHTRTCAHTHPHTHTHTSGFQEVRPNLGKGKSHKSEVFILHWTGPFNTWSKITRKKSVGLSWISAVSKENELEVQVHRGRAGKNKVSAYMPLSPTCRTHLLCV